MSYKFKIAWILNIIILLMAIYPLQTYKQNVIIDTDAGADDAMAILMLLSSHKQINVVAITCVQGNTGVHNVSINVLKTLAIMNRLDIPVYVGSATGLVYYKKPGNFFGEDGLGDFVYFNPPSTELLQKEHAAVAMANIVKQKPGDITIVAIGPLTNLALASLINPDFFSQVKNIFIMGGSYKGGGNIGPGIEFNIYSDPEAAASFFTKLPVSTPTLLLPFEPLQENYLNMNWRVNTLGKIKSEKMYFLNLVENKKLIGKLWGYWDQALSAIMLNPQTVTSYIQGLPVVNTTANRGAMNITIGVGAVKIVTGLNRMELKKTFITYLS